MSQYQLVDDLYLYPTPAGVFHAVTTLQDDPICNLLRVLLGMQACPKADTSQLCEWLGCDEQQALALLHQAQAMSWIHGIKEPKVITQEGIGQEMAS